MPRGSFQGGKDLANATDQVAISQSTFTKGDTAVAAPMAHISQPVRGALSGWSYFPALSARSGSPRVCGSAGLRPTRQVPTTRRDAPITNAAQTGHVLCQSASEEAIRSDRLTGDTTHLLVFASERLPDGMLR
jgi:hypothetical protein